ncbi:alpha/beta fold hydrolase [Sphingorhabdus contaminans]|uniref:Alpha/beta hydrolase n=1 Tax=Sphingorhabdus contaminans TaxID=1343899 RepID=A0A553WAX1_9SPHN|nr:alpha/beta hydrolase [Sphingorhabdus contaminans]TSB01837.1 alpha/beta hydrolase [Sphingorhabdus contaminans]
MNLLAKLVAVAAFLFATPLWASDVQVDPAVVYANEHGDKDNPYRQGWYGKGETRLHYVEAGKGPLVILYHGFPSTWFSWFDLMEELKGRYRVVAVDALGAGLSGKPRDLAPYRIDRLARQLDGLARKVDGNRPFVLIGHDWGAALSLAYAQAYPRRVKAVVGMSAPPYNLFLDLVTRNEKQRAMSAYMQTFRTQSYADVRDSGFAPRFAAQVYGALRDAGHLTKEEASLFEKAVGDVDAMSGGMNWYRANLPPFEKLDESWYWPRDNRPIQAPTLIIWGDRDHTFLPVFLDQMPAYARSVSVAHFPGVGHMTPIESSGPTNKRIAQFLADHR